MFKILGVALIALALAACSLTSADVTRKTFDAICYNEPAIYRAYVTIATARGASEAKLQRAATAHFTIDGICKNPPTDLASGVVTIASAYAIILASRSEVARTAKQ